MKKTSWMLASGLMLATAVALAGGVSTVPVSVTVNADQSGSAFGNMTSARRAANNVEMIGCSIQRYLVAGQVTAYGWCQARNAANVLVFCSSDNPQLLDAVQGIGDYSYISFAWGADGFCNKIAISTQSVYIP